MIIHERFPNVFANAHLQTWFAIQAHLLTRNTVEAYARALEEYILFCYADNVDPANASQEQIAGYVHEMSVRPVKKGSRIHLGLSNATMQQRIVAVRLYYDYLKEEGLREINPVKRGVYTPNKGFGGRRRGILAHYKKLPWIPNEDQWQTIIMAAQEESLRNRLMLALAYDAGLRREELIKLHIDDIDPSHRLITIRAETTKNKRGRVVPYSISTGYLYMAYLNKRRELSRVRGPLFLSESRRNKAKPISIWIWSKVVNGLAKKTGMLQLSTHTFRHLCLTDLARSGWDLHEISSFAGHKSINTTLIYIHLSGRDLAEKFAKSMSSIHASRVQMIQHNLMKNG